MHQGDHFGSVLFTLAIHDQLIDLFGAHDVHVFGYADNLTLFGEVESVTDAAVQLREGFMEDGLALNGAELEFYCPVGEAPASVIDSGGDALIPVAREGLKVLGGAVGTDAFCMHVLSFRPGQVFKVSRGGLPDIISLMQIYLPLLIQ